MGLRILPLLIILCSLATSATAGVSSLSTEQPVFSADGEEYWEVSVKCTGRKTERRPIWRKQSGGEWCAKDVSGFCKKSKMAAALKVCSFKYMQAVEDAQSDEQQSSGGSRQAVVESVLNSNPENQNPRVAIKENAKPASPSRITSSDSSVTTSEKVSSSEVAPANENHSENRQPQEQPAPNAGGDIESDFERDKLALEKERLLVEQQRLELRKQRIRLQQQELELKKQLEKAKSNSPEKPPATAKKQEDEDSSKPVTVQQKVLGL
ncbi:MAG: hypothetical protein H7A02_06210 [Pseudomonadales bacterium]|nr:hypothetical protein [Pseudomonadales bacterium]